MDRLTDIVVTTAKILVRDAQREAALGRPSDWAAQLLGEIRGTLHLVRRMAEFLEPAEFSQVRGDLQAAKTSLERLRAATAA